jgi:hypothetical protein
MNATAEADGHMAELSAMLDEARDRGSASLCRAGATLPSGITPAGAALIALLTAGIYERYHARTASGRTSAAAGPDPQFRAELARANGSRSRWDPGWRVFAAGPLGAVVAEKHGRIRVARPGEFRCASTPPMSPGSALSLWAPRDMDTSHPAFYLTLGETLPDLWREVPTVRIYFHVAAAGAATLLNCTTEFCNRRGMPFGMKCLANPAGYDRADAAVLYVAPPHYDTIAELLAELPPAVRRHLRPEIPLFAKKLAAGLALAEQPGTGESFGQHRSRLLAEAVLLGSMLGARSTEPALAVIRQHFAAHGIDLGRPHLNPGSIDRYALPVVRSSS